MVDYISYYRSIHLEKLNEDVKETSLEMSSLEKLIFINKESEQNKTAGIKAQKTNKISMKHNLIA